MDTDGKKKEGEHRAAKPFNVFGLLYIASHPR
jgi:hypothetical protein